MEKKRDWAHAEPSDSYSRQLDAMVQRQEMPYGYETSPPPADTGDHDMASRQSNKRYGKQGR